MRGLSLAIASSLVILALQGASVRAAETAAAPNTVAATADSRVARAVITTAVRELEPVDAITQLGAEHNKVYFFTELRDMAGERIRHRWEYHGQVMAEVEFAIAGPRWRVYSSKNVQPEWAGEWQVSVVDATGAPLAVNSFSYAAAPESSGSAARPAQ